MRFTTTLKHSLALALPFLCLITADDFPVGGQFRLRIYTKECEGLSVKTKVNGVIHQTECGEADWGTEADGIDGYPIIGEVPIDRTGIEDSSTKFSFNKGPKDHPYEQDTECTLTFKEDPYIRNLVWKIGQGLDYAGPGQSQPYNLKGGDTLRLTCEEKKKKEGDK